VVDLMAGTIKVLTYRAMVQVVLVDDHPLYRSGLKALLQAQPDLTVAAELDDARQAILAGPSLKAELFLVDVRLPDTDGIALIRELRRQDPGRRFLMLTMYDDGDHVARALEAGATGYALKSDSTESTLAAIRSAVDGTRWISPKIVGRLDPKDRSGLASLSPREREVFDLAVRGLSGRGIAKKLFISYKTVESHRYKINRKLGVRSLAELVRFAALQGLPLS
jgi:DNA-binding NarL/FixJ family response regulator